MSKAVRLLNCADILSPPLKKKPKYTATPNARKARLAITLGGLFMALGNQAKPENGGTHATYIRAPIARYRLSIGG